MSVILEFTIEDDAFQLGQVLAPPPRIHIELERIVPTGDMVMPFLWVTGSSIDAFEQSVRDHPSVERLHALDTVDGSSLYRIDWTKSPTDLIEAIGDAEAVVLEAMGNDTWAFRLRFPDHEKLSQFHNYIIEHEIPIHIERTYTLTETPEHGHVLGLTVDQREAIVLALQRGYFSSPSEMRLDDLADILGITRQALSKRIRRANETILREVPLSSAAGYD